MIRFLIFLLAVGSWLWGYIQPLASLPIWLDVIFDGARDLRYFKSYFRNGGCTKLTLCNQFQDCSRALDASIACDGENFGDIFCANCYAKRFVPRLRSQFKPLSHYFAIQSSFQIADL